MRSLKSSFGGFRPRRAGRFIRSSIVWLSGVCVLRYDNEAGKGDHRHIEDREEIYRFRDPKKLLEDFWNDVEARRR
jgi:hypothetical protein